MYDVREEELDYRLQSFLKNCIVMDRRITCMLLTADEFGMENV